jgi:hypothetical protein
VYCEWYASLGSAPGYPPPEDSEVDSDGKTTNNGCSFSRGPACNVIVVTLSARQCAQNLALSTCSAPLAELTDCVTTAYNQCLPSPHGCARFLETTGCSGTLVIGYSESTGAGAASGFGAAPTAGTSAGTPAAGAAGGAGGAGGEEVPPAHPCAVQVE